MKRIFLVGAPRSGTTILQSLLASHPEIISVPESRFFHYLLDPEMSKRFSERLEKFFVEEIDRPEFLSKFSTEQSQDERVKQFVDVLDTLAKDKGKTIWLEKTPEHIYFVEYIEKFCPDALFIHILRNPLDVIASMYEASRKAPEAWFGAWSLDHCINRWVEATKISHASINKANHVLVSYEEFVESPQKIALKLCDFLDIEFNPSMLTNYKETAKQLSLGAVWHQGIERDIKSSKVHKYHLLFQRGDVEYILPRLKPTRVGMNQEIKIEVTEPLRDISLPTSVDRIYGRVELEGEALGWLELPVCDGLVTAAVLADAIAVNFAWQILGRFWERTVWKTRKEDKEGFQKLHEKMGWTVFLQEIWGRQNWPIERFYNPNIWEEEIPTVRVKNSFTEVEISEEIPHLEVSLPELDVLLKIGGVSIGMVTIPVERNFISAQALRVALTNTSGFELCRACVREALLGKPLDEGTPLRSRLAQKAQATRVQSTGMEPFVAYPTSAHTVVLGRTCGALGTSASRYASFPRGAVRELLEMSLHTGVSAIQVPPAGKSVQQAIYAPDFLWPSSRSLTRYCPAKPKENPLKRWWQKAWHPASASKEVMTQSLPILMYHRVATGGLEVGMHYRVTPSAFEEQLLYLHEAGYRCAGWQEWQMAIATHKPLPGKAVIITFDGGYMDFFEFAWPLLKRYEFKATVLLASDRVGQTNSWEHAYLEEVPLMGWKEIRQLRDEGVDFGSLSATYQPLTTLSPIEVVREAARSRSILERGIGAPIHTFAYPYGDSDACVQHLVGACGYTFGLQGGSRLSRLSDDLLRLPRVEILGTDGIQEFANKLTSDLSD